MLLVAGYSGNANNAMLWLNGKNFTTYDRDNDKFSDANCAERNGGGFWYSTCAVCAVNADPFNKLGSGYSFGWSGLPGGRLLQTSRMWLQCK